MPTHLRVPDKAAQIVQPASTPDKLLSLSCSCCRSYSRAGFGGELIVLDNTINSTLADDPVVAELAAEVMPTRTRLTFSQAQNFMAGGRLVCLQTLHLSR